MPLFDPYSIVVVTNAIVMCFEIQTTELVPAPCPDGIEGCCVEHFQKRKTTRYVPCHHNQALVATPPLPPPPRTLLWLRSLPRKQDKDARDIELRPCMGADAIRGERK